ncbi:MAG: Maf family protein [Thermoguttaceae bacterium]|nr:Maf family protein [Thermoguttaceae bacterium]MDW8037604.1 Maf family protein [Thermoguttaceae bacterium]
MPKEELSILLKSVRLILASRSPRRRELLAEAGYEFEVIPPSEEAEEESFRSGESAAELAGRLARQKAADVVRRIANRFAVPSLLTPEKESVATAGGETDFSSRISAIVLGCDTVVECQGQILGKPTDQEDARRILQCLSGQEHWVYSGLCLWPLPTGKPQCQVAASRLRMDSLRPEQLEEYLQSGQWQGKAGAFGYQDRLGWVHLLEGSESNVVGLPLELLAEMLAQMLPTNIGPSHPT